jgi:hypothetical protein
VVLLQRKYQGELFEYYPTAKKAMTAAKDMLAELNPKGR